MSSPMGWAEDTGASICLHGEIDLSNVEEVGRELVSLISDSGGSEVIIDLGLLEYIDSQGIAMLLKLAGELREQGRTLRLRAPDDSIAGELLSISRLGDLRVDRATADG